MVNFATALWQGSVAPRSRWQVWGVWREKREATWFLGKNPIDLSIVQVRCVCITVLCDVNGLNDQVVRALSCRPASDVLSWSPLSGPTWANVHEHRRRAGRQTKHSMNILASQTLRECMEYTTLTPQTDVPLKRSVARPSVPMNVTCQHHSCSSLKFRRGTGHDSSFGHLQIASKCPRIPRMPKNC